MQENKNIRLLISLIVLIACAGITYVLMQEENNSVADPRLFQVPDPTKIDRIELESKKGKIDLHFNGTQWKVNDRYEADRNLIDVLFATLEKAVPKRPVAALQVDSVNLQFDKGGIIVSLFEGELLRKRFEAGANKLQTDTYFREAKDRVPYLITIPGYRVNVYPIFELGENDWREKRIFNFSWRNFKSLRVDFPSEPASGFEIGRQSKVFGIVGLEKTDTARLNTFLDDVSLLVADQIISPGSSKIYDSLAKTTPVISLRIEDIAHRGYRLDLFAPLAGEVKIAGRAFDNEIVLFDRKKTSSIYKKRSYFRMK